MMLYGHTLRISSLSPRNTSTGRAGAQRYIRISSDFPTRWRRMGDVIKGPEIPGSA